MKYLSIIHTRALLVSVLLAVAFGACKGSPKPPVLTPKAELSKSNVAPEGETIVLKIKSDEAWSIVISQPIIFVRASAVEGRGKADVALKVLPNRGAERQADIEVTFANNMKEKVSLVQRKGDPHAMRKALEARLEIPKLSQEPFRHFVAHFAPTPAGDEVMNLCLEYDVNKHQSRWVAFRFDKETRPVNVKRRDTWSDDPQLIGLCPLGTYTEWEGKKMDRGHIVASYDRVYSAEANDQTFYYSNIAPQIGSTFNSSVWGTLESRVQSWGRDASFADTLYVVKGITIDRDEDIMGYVTARENQMKVPVARKWYMALLKVRNGQYAAVAFLFDHKEYDSPKLRPEYRCSVDELEQAVGVDFFHNLPDNVEQQVEQEVNLTYWRGLQ